MYHDNNGGNPMGDNVYKNKNNINLIKFIDENIANDLKLTSLPNVGYISQRQIYRDFYSATGHSLNEYKRKRQLSKALMLIKNSEMSLVEIAYLCGFSSQQALCRAIKERINLTPSEYRNSEVHYFFPQYYTSNSLTIIVAIEQMPSTACFRFYSHNFLHIEDNAVKKLFSQMPQYRGRVFGYNGKQIENGFYYDLYLTDTTIKQLNGFEYCGIKNGFSTKFASTAVKYNEKMINNALNMLHNEWLPTSMFESSHEPYFEEYLIRNAKPFKLKLYLPIVKRDDDMKITIIKNPELCYAIVTAQGCGAEKIATNKIVEYMYENRLNINSLREYLICKNQNEYTCGVRVIGDFDIVDNSISIFKTDGEHYILLENDVAGDYNFLAEKLIEFACDNGFDVDKDSIFAVYDGELNPKKPKMKMYVKMKFGKI